MFSYASQFHALLSTEWRKRFFFGIEIIIEEHVTFFNKK